MAGVVAVVGSKSLAILLLFPALIACNNVDAQWCEFDETDQVVDDAYCYDEVPGYEWEPDGDDHEGVVFIPPVNHGNTYKTSKVPTYKAPPPVYKAPTYKAPAPVYKPPPPAPKSK